MITRGQYVDRLEEMLKVEKPCVTCPGIEDFEDYQDACKIEESWRKEGKIWLDANICYELCNPFIELPVTASKFERSRCPCYALGGAKALKCAHIAVEAYRNGSHRWCGEKEEGE